MTKTKRAGSAATKTEKKGKKKKKRPSAKWGMKVLKYGAIVDFDSDEHRDQIMNMFWGMNRYRNKLVELDRDRRAKTDRVLWRHSKELKQLDAKIKRKRAKEKELFDKIRADRVLTQSRNDVMWQRGHDDLKAEIKSLWGERKKIATALFKDPEVKEELEPINEAAKAALKEARGSNDLYWGQYLKIEQAADKFGEGAPPQFKRYDGGGSLSVQFQGGACIDDLMGDSDTRLQFGETFGKGKVPWRKARIRIGSTEDRKPIWLDFTVKIHRPVPPEGRIKWARLCARRIGPHIKWSLQLEVDHDWDKDRKVTKKGVVVVRPGWALRADGIVVADMVDDGGWYSQLVIPNWVINRNRKVLELQSTRDKNFDAFRNKLVKWLPKLSPDLQERLEHLPRWRSCARLSKVVVYWRHNRFKGDSRMFAQAEAWRAQNKHLYSWEAHQRESVQNWRLNLYRNLASDLTKGNPKKGIAPHGTIVLPEVNYQSLDRHKELGTDDGSFRMPAEYRRLAAVSYLTNALKQKQGLKGAYPHVVKVEAKGMAQVCGNCLKEYSACECGVPMHWAKCMFLFRQYWANDQKTLARFFKSRTFTNLIRLMKEPPHDDEDRRPAA